MSVDPFGDHPVVLSEDERQAIQAWVDAVAPSLGLDGWRLIVTPHEAEPDAWASSFIRDQMDEATVALATNWHELPPERLRHTLTHELLHPHFQRVTRLAEKLLENELGRRTEAVIEAAIEEAEEQAIDRLSWALARFLPLVALPEHT